MTFKNSYDAEITLCNDLQRFLQQPDILDLIPPEIKKHLDHWGDCGQIEGFGKLFNYLERNQAAVELRKSIKDYFRIHRDLRGHLSTFVLLTVSTLRSPF
jgi:hypothetical protein